MRSCIDRYEQVAQRLYVIGESPSYGFFKIGITDGRINYSRRQVGVELRLQQLQVGNPRLLIVVAQVAVLRDLRDAERIVHYYLRQSKAFGEWFCSSERLTKILSLMKNRRRFESWLATNPHIDGSEDSDASEYERLETHYGAQLLPLDAS